MNPNDKIYGLSEYIYDKKNPGCRVWIYGRQSFRELADTFFHEMTHVFLHFFCNIRNQGKREEMAASWNGYISKLILHDYDSKKFRRSGKWK